MSGKVDYKSAASTPAGGPSPSIWANCPTVAFLDDPALGSHFFDDFIDGVDIATNKNSAAVSALGTTGAWTGFTGTTSNTVATLATDIRGVIAISGTTDDEGSKIIYPKGAAIAGKFKFTSGKRLWMEAKIKVDSIADTISQIYVGFAEEGLITAGTLLTTSEGGLADKDYVGFVREYADGDKLNIDFNTASGSTSPVSDSDSATLVAAAWTKIGMYFDGVTLRFYQDGALIDYTVGLTDTDFPDGEEMAFYIETMCGAAGTTSVLNVDWVRLAQDY